MQKNTLNSAFISISPFAIEMRLRNDVFRFFFVVAIFYFFFSFASATQYRVHTIVWDIAIGIVPLKGPTLYTRVSCRHSADTLKKIEKKNK